MTDSSLQAFSNAPDQAATFAPISELVGSKDGEGAGDHDSPFVGFQASHFSTRQMVRLLLLRTDVLDARLGQGPLVDDLAAR